MGVRKEVIAPENYYHIYNRGVNMMDIFVDDHDRQRFCDLLVYYLPREHVRSFSVKIHGKTKRERRSEVLSHFTRAGVGLVDLNCNCLMDNHIHLLLRENTSGGISTYAQRVFTSYAKYFNTKHERQGPLYSGRFRAVRIESDEQFLHLTRYIHLNPYAASMVDDPYLYRWSSLREYLPGNKSRGCHTAFLKTLISSTEYSSFVIDYADYARELEAIKHVSMDG